MKEFSFAIIPDPELGRSVLDLTDRFRGIREAVIGEEIERRLLDTVNFINTLKIDFVVTVGDLTDSALPAQFFRAKEILDNLGLWLPVIGNHDLHPFIKLPDPFFSRRHSWENESLTGPIIFEEIFQENFQRLSKFFDGSQKQKTSFQNYTFLHKGVRFIIIDNMSRRHAILGFPGVIGTPHLYPETRDWIRQQLSQKEERKIVISHAPLKRKLLKNLSGNGEVVNIAGHWHKQNLRKSNNITTFVTGALYLKPVINVVKVLTEEVEIQSVRIP